MLTSSTKHLALLLIFCFIPLAVYLRSETFQTYFYGLTSKKSSQQSSAIRHEGFLDETATGAPRIAQVSMQFGGHRDLMNEKALRTHIENGDKWGYPTHYLRQDIVGKGDVAEGVYDKLLYLQTIMVTEMAKSFGKRAEWLVWFDADTILLNNNVPWTIFLPPNEGNFRDINLLASKDWSGFNAGVFLIRICEWSINLLSDAIALPRLRHDIELAFREQAALNWVFNEPENLKHRIFQPRHWFNVYDEYYQDRGEVVKKGSLIVHFPGMGGARADAMGRWLDKLDHSPEELRIPLENTTYPSEVEDYWSQLRSAFKMLQTSADYKEQEKKEHFEIFTSKDPGIASRIEEAEWELNSIIQEDAFDTVGLREAEKNLRGTVQDAKKDVAETLLKKQEEEAKARQVAKEKAEEDKRKEEEKERKEEVEEEEEEEEEEETAEKIKEQEQVKGSGRPR